MPTSDRLTVYTLISCPTAEAIPASLALFGTLRVGFPSAVIRIFDNHVCPEAARQIARLAHEAGCEVCRPQQSCRTHTFLGEVVMNPDHKGAIVILDPGIIFWDSCESWHFDRLMGGRLVPRYLDEVGGCVSLTRLHPSFWWIPRVEALRERIVREYRTTAIGYLDAFLPYAFRDLVSGVWYRLDTGANLYAALSDSMQPFTPAQLDCFDYPFTVPQALPPMSAPDRDRASLDRLKGIWRAHDEYFRTRSIPSMADLVSR